MQILLVEDDEQLRASIARGLREAGCTVDETGTGREAQTMALAREYDAVVLDILLPGKSGLAVCQAVREKGSRVPILMLTALDAVEQRIAGLDAGADDYLTKPFAFGELLARLRALVRRSSGVVPPEIVVGNLVIDTRKQTARRGRRTIDMTPREYGLLCYLAQHAGRVVSRRELLAEVWGDTEGTYSNIIDAYAARLRRKLDDGEKVPLLATRRGSGFLLDAPSRRSARRPT